MEIIDLPRKKKWCPSYFLCSFLKMTFKEQLCEWLQLQLCFQGHKQLAGKGISHLLMVPK